MTYTPNEKGIDIANEIDLAAIATFNVSPALPNFKGFKIWFWDFDLNSLSRSPSLRFYAPGLIQSSIHRIQRYDKQHGTSYTQSFDIFSNTQPWFNPSGPSAFALVYGYWEGMLLDESTNDWAVYGNFRDDFSSSLASTEVFGQITLPDTATACRIQSGNGLNWDAGKASWATWN